MRLTGFLILAAVLQVSAKGRAQTVTYSAHSAPLTKVLSAVGQQTGYHVFYDDADLEGSLPVTVQLKEAPIQQAMEIIMTGQPLRFVILGNTISIARKPALSILPAPAVTPPGDIHGRIVSEDGEPVAANIIVKGAKRGTSTNAKGEFELKHVEGNITLVVSGVTFETFEIKLNGKTELGTLTVKKKVDDMREIVVNKGYYSTKQMYNTGNVTTVSGDDIRKAPVTDPILALEGRVPGLYISQTSGIPGASYTIRLRGQNSISNGNNPLYIVDGVPFNPNSLSSPDFGTSLGYGNGNATYYYSTGGLSPFNMINPNDIESIEVLKDADATAIYGSKGANGVVLITTRKGKAGPTKLDIDLSSATGTVAHKLDMLNTKQYLMMRREAFKNDGVLPGATDYDVNGTWDTTRYTDWQKALINNAAHLTRANVSLSGGNANTTFLLSGGYSRQTTVFPWNYHDQVLSVSMVLNHSSVNQKFNLQFKASYADNDNLVPATDFTFLLKSLAPDAPPMYDANGNINFQDGHFYENPASYALQSASSVADNLNSDLSLKYEILPGLKLQSDVGINRSLMTQSSLTPDAAIYGPPVATNRRNLVSNSSRNTWNVDPQLNYNRTFGKAKLSAIIGADIQRDLYSNLSQFAMGFSSDDLIKNIVYASTVTVAGNEYADYRSNHMYGAINYIWDDKYVLNATGSRDGSSRFGPANRYGSFVGIGGAWLFYKEKFVIRGLPFLSFGKLRASYGTTGNDQISDYQYLSTYVTNNTYQGMTGLVPNQLASPGFAWEVVKKMEGGVELGFLKDRINLTVSYYRNRTGNQLVGQTLPGQDGFTSITANLPAVVQNTGMEAVLSTTNIRSGKFTWTTSFNISAAQKNKLVSFPGLAFNPNYAGSYTIGKPIFTPKIYHFTGVDPQTGMTTVQDVDGNGVLTVEDRQLIKPITQDYYGGFLNSFSYKGWQLDVLFQFVKQTGKTFVSNFAVPGSMGNNEPVDVLRRWQNPGDLTDVPKFTTGGGGGAKALSAYYTSTSSDRYVADASFIRLKNLALSYTFPLSWQHALGLQGMRFYVNAQNLLSLTKFKGFDPESQGTNLPPLRMISFGVRASL